MESISKVTSKYQATIPAQVRKALGIGKGDAVKFEVRGDRVTLKRATAIDLAFAKAVEGTMSEWHSTADDEAYRDL